MPTPSKKLDLVDSSTVSVVIAQDIKICDNVVKQYYGFVNTASAIEFVTNANEDDRCFHEVMRNDTHRKLYFDFDMVTDPEQTYDEEHFEYTMMNALKTLLYDGFGIVLYDYDENDKCTIYHRPIFMYSSRPDKFSSHIVIPSLYSSISEIKILSKKLKYCMSRFGWGDNKEINSQGIDMQVYKKTQHFRLAGSHKLGSPYVLEYNLNFIENTFIGIYYKEKQIFPDDDEYNEDYYWKCKLNKCDTKQYREVITGPTCIKIELKQEHQHYLEVKPITSSVKYNTNDDITIISKLVMGLSIERAQDYANWKSVCLAIGGCGASESVAIEFTKRVVKSNVEEALRLWTFGLENKSVTVRTLWWMLKKDNPALFNELFKESTKNNDFSSVRLHERIESIPVDYYNVFMAKMKSELPENTNVEEFDKKFCSEYEQLVQSDIPIIALRSNMGTGKTVMASKRADRLGENDRLLIASFRKTLSTQYLDTFSNVDGLASYMNMENNDFQTTNRIIIQAESLHKMAWDTKGRTHLVDEIIIDEITQVRSQFTSTTFIKQGRKNAKKSYNAFKNLIAGAKSVVIMDANITGTDIKWIQSLRDDSSKECKLFLNTTPHLSGRTARITECQEELITMMCNDVKEFRKIYVAINRNIKYIEAIAQLLKSQRDNVNVLVITSYTMLDDNIRPYIDDPNKWGDFDVVLCSPCLQSGISCTTRDAFHTLYGIFSNNTNMSKDALQQVHRVRYPISSEVVISVCESNNNIGPISRTQIMAQIQANTRHHLHDGLQQMTEYRLDPNDMNNYVYKMNDYANLLIDNEIERNQDLMNFQSNMLKQLICDGYKITEHKNIMDELSQKALKQSMNELKKCIDKNDTLAIASAVELTHEQLKKMDNEGVTSTQELLSLKKHKVLNLYDCVLPSDKIKADAWFLKYNDEKTMNLYKNMRYRWQFNTIDDYLADTKQNETLRLVNTQIDTMKTIDNTNDDKVSIIAIYRNENDRSWDSSYFMSTQARDLKYGKVSIVLGWLKMMGWGSWNTSIIISRSDLVDSLKLIHDQIKENPERVILVLGKDKRKIDIVSSWVNTDKQFVGNMMKFVNGAMSNYGYQIIATGKRNPNYKLTVPGLGSLFVEVHNIDTPHIPCLIESDNPNIYNKLWENNDDISDVHESAKIMQKLMYIEPDEYEVDEL